MKKITLLGLIAIAAIFTSTLQAESQKLRYVIDGDTAKFAHTTCRFAYIDTPESRFNNKLKRDISKAKNVTADEVIKAGRIAKGYVKSLMQKGEVYEFDITSTDRYGRSICVIYDKDGTTINSKIIKNGFGVPFWRYIPTEVKPSMISAVRYAKKNGKGLWRTNRNVMDMMN